MRLQTFLSHAGVASRRACEEIIGRGRVAVNGAVVRERGFAVTPGADRVTLDGTPVAPEEKRYYLMNKPRGVTSTMRDAHAARSVVDLLPRGAGRLYPVGRLDKETTGLLLMTNDGDLAYRLTHPRFGVSKVYRARVEGVLSGTSVGELRRGIALEEGVTAPCRVRVVSQGTGSSVCEIELREGKKRQVRRMFAAIGHRVTELERVSFGGIALGSMKEGTVRELTAGELASLRKASGPGRQTDR